MPRHPAIEKPKEGEIQPSPRWEKKWDEVEQPDPKPKYGSPARERRQQRKRAAKRKTREERLGRKTS